MGGHQNRRSGAAGFEKSSIEIVAARGVQAGMGFVEQPDLGATGHETGQCRTTPLPRGQTTRGHIGESTGEIETFQHRFGLGSLGADRGGPELDVLAYRELTVEPVGMSQQTHPGAHLLALGAYVETQHPGPTPAEGDQTGQHPQQGGLTRTVGSADQHDLMAGHGEIGTGQGREPSQHCHGVVHLDGGMHTRRRYRLVAPATESVPRRPIASRIVIERESPPRRSPSRANQVLGVIGRLLISIGLLLLGFVGYQLWGTGIEQSQAQNRLAEEFDTLLGASATSPVTIPPVEAPDTTANPDPTPVSTTAPSPTQTSTTVTTTTETTVPVPYALGGAVARLEIPRLDLDQVVVAGVGTTELKAGPGHFPGTPLPGRLGNAALAGHRTSYGAPFGDLDRLEPGDEILVTTLEGEFRYVVEDSFVVAPTDTYVVETVDREQASLTLVTCHPRYSTQQRLIVTATMPGDASESTPVTPTVPTSTPATSPPGPAPVPTPETPDFDPVTAPVPAWNAEADPFASGWFADSAAWWHVAGWGTLLAAVAILATWLGHRRHNQRFGAVIGVLPFLVVLYFFYQNLNRLLPAGL